jgi:hypothetical protein
MNNHSFFERILGSKRMVLFFSAFVMGVMYIIGGLTNFVPIVLAVILIGG